MPEFVVTTKSLHPRDKFSFWHDVACRAFVEHDWRPVDRRSFEAEVRATSLEAIKLAVCSNDAMTIWRSERQAARATSDTIFANVQLSGTTNISQDGKDVTVESGGLTLVDSQRPYTLRFGNGSKHLVAQISRREIEARVGCVSAMMAYRVDRDNGVGKLAAEFLQILAGRAGDIPEFSRAQLGSQAVDLLGLALSAGSARKKQLSSPRTISLLRLKRAIEARLSNSEATCADFALSAGISIRYANQLLATETTSLERYILDRRLEKCRCAFDDCRQDARTITEIAFSWGFSDLSHFGRIFKDRYSLTPRDYRAQSRASR